MITEIERLPGFNIFCAGHSWLPDGRLFIAGGALAGVGTGANYATIYDPATESWSKVPDMGPDTTHKRWYPTNTTLENGQVLVMAGTNDPGDEVERSQVYVPSTNTWRDLTAARKSPGPPY